MAEKDNAPIRARWTSGLSFVWVASGAAVGLGNIWKFPYMAGKNGGSAFVILYLSFVFLLAFPVMVGEIYLGKISQKNPVDGFISLAKIEGFSKRWGLVGFLGLITLFFTFCFYSLVAGFSLIYLLKTFEHGFANLQASEIELIWTNVLESPSLLIGSSFSFVFLTMAVVFFGVKSGIERVCTWLMPALLVVLVCLVVYGGTQFGMAPTLDFLFSFSWQEITPGVVVSSMGHAFFTLAVGACAMMVYGSYLGPTRSVIRSVVLIVFLDIFVALLAGLAIFPLIFAHDLSPSAGPGLMFISLPIAFASMSFGNILALLFFVLLFFAAISSSLSFAEPLVSFAIEKIGFRRSSATLLVGLATFLGSIVCALSFNLWADIKIFDRFSIFDAIADFSTNILLPIGGIGIAIFSGLVVKVKHFEQCESKVWQRLYPIWKALVLFVCPLSILAIMIREIWQMFI